MDNQLLILTPGEKQITQEIAAKLKTIINPLLIDVIELLKLEFRKQSKGRPNDQVIKALVCSVFYELIMSNTKTETWQNERQNEN